MITHLDTETTGLPVAGAPSDDPRHPRIVTIGAFLDDEAGITRRSLYSIIKPDGYSWDESLTMTVGKEVKPTAYAIHKIKFETAMAFGRPAIQVMEDIADMISSSTTIIAFNKFFDFKMLKIEAARCGSRGEALRALFESKLLGCTMLASAQRFKGPTQRFMKLDDAYPAAFGKRFEDAHNSYADAGASRAIYLHLSGLGVTDFGQHPKTKITAGAEASL